MEQTQLDEIRTQLDEELASIERQLQEHGVPAEGEAPTVDVDEGFADSASATAERSQLLSIIEQLQQHRTDIKDALTRMDEGVYGKCQRCGNDIPPERLEARPATRFCVKCQQELSG
jgi:RNA polymerase-binding protein DksA